MPVYEFYCSDCHAVFNFLSRQVNTDKRPTCPRCGRPELERQVSRFAISKNRPEPDADGLPAGLDEEKMEQAMMALAGEMEGVDENDPRAMARFMRKFSEMTGMSLGGAAEEAMRRLAAGEDPEQIETELGELFGDGDNLDGLFGKERLAKIKRRLAPPEHDETLYTM
ncbi:MAG: zinc ribbon domain-containing protein [Desulfuromonadales bacterium]|nr:zinc ribbon domain-containing protein [Desulfuromonadales bacterium]